MVLPTPLPPALVARLQAAEAQLYPLGLADPDVFERATSLVALVAASLLPPGDLDTLVDACPGALARLPDAAREAGLSVEGVPLGTVVDAALAMRVRTLSQSSPAAPWRVTESGSEELFAGIHWRRELHMATGVELRSTAQDLPGAPIRYQLELFRPADARSADPSKEPVTEPAPAWSWATTDRDEWLRRAADARTEIETRGWTDRP